MKKIILSLILMVAGLTMTGCYKSMNPVAPLAQPQGVMIKAFALGGNAMTATAKTLTVEAGTQVTFYAAPYKSGMKSYQWIFTDNGATFYANGQTASHAFSLTQASMPKINLIATDSSGNVYKDSLLITVVYSLDNLPDVVWISYSPATGGKFNEVIAFKKSKVSFAPGSYNYTGNYNGGWDSANVAPQDTNWLVVNNGLVAPNPGDQGKYFVVRLALSPNTYKIGVGKGKVWGAFNSPYFATDSTHILIFSIMSDGSPTSSVVPALPGAIGDSVLQLKLQDTSLVLYTNNGAAFSSISPFIVLYDSNGVARPPLPEYAVTNYPNWGGNVIVPYSSLPSYHMVQLNYGNHIASPYSFNPNRTKSIYWDATSQTLKFVVAVVSDKIKILTVQQYKKLLR